MSTKTTFKRIALVAVASLGFGMLTVSSSSAAVVAAGDTYSQISVTLDNTNTTLAGRVGQQVSIAVTGSIVAGGSAGNASGAANTFAGYSLATAITAQPATSAVYPTIAAPGATLGGSLNVHGVGLTAGSTILTSGSTSTGTATAVATVNVTQSEKATATTAVAAGTTLGTVTFTPTATGTYTVTVWNEKDRSYGAVSGTTSQVLATTQASLSGSESSKTFTINVSNGVSSITLTKQNSSAAANKANGALIKVTLKDAAGNPAILAPGEAVTLTPSGTGDIAAVNNTPVTSVAGAAYNLSAGDFNSSGVAWINMVDAAAGDTTVTAAIAGGANTSTTVTFVTTVAAAAALATSSTATGHSGTTTGIKVPIGSSTVSFRASASTGSSVAFTVTEELIGGAGSITGYTTALTYDGVAGGNTTLTYASFSVTATTAANSDVAYKISSDATGNATTGAVQNAATGTESIVTAATNTAGVLTLTPGNVNSVVGASNTFTVSLKDLFRRAYANQTVTATVAGKNPTTAAMSAVTNAAGQVTFTVTDANTNTAVSDTLTVSAGSSVSASIAYGTNAVGTITMKYPNEDDVVAGTTFTEISAAGAGATGTSATVSAVVTGSTGALLAGVPVTFAVSGLTGAEVHTTLVTVYTNTSGVASTAISSYAAGKATVTATAGGKSSTADIYFKQTGVDEARTIAATVSGNLVTATVKDRYGNTIQGVTVNATRSGTGFFGSGASTASGNTDKNGQIEFIFTGTGTVTVAFTSDSYGQSADAAGKVGITAVTASAAGTTTTAQTGVGAALAPAGVNSASVAVDSANEAATNASAAADAAAEATDAANAATDAANAAAEAADAATAAAQDAADAVAALSASVTEMVSALKKQITSLTNLVIKIQKKVRA
jgi:trimeric autotransporter adhesin